MCLTLPSTTLIHQAQNPILYRETENARSLLKRQLAEHFSDAFLDLFYSIKNKAQYEFNGKEMGKRSLKAVCRSYLRELGNKFDNLLYDSFVEASNMTEELGALSDLLYSHSKMAPKALEMFYQKWKHETLVMQKWLSIQAQLSDDQCFDLVLGLEKNPVYDGTVPNLVRSLFGAFSSNSVQFNHESGRGYELVAKKIIELDAINPQMASRLMSQFKYFKRLPPTLKTLMEKELLKIKAVETLSKNTYEILSKILEA